MTEIQDPVPVPPASLDHGFKPRGAILIVTILGLTTLAVWFGLFALTALRYAP
ncbi:MAG: cytochrome c oxidase subunit 2A [Acidiphilium sp.]